jgi:hypothetical protein
MIYEVYQRNAIFSRMITSQGILSTENPDRKKSGSF